MPALTLQRIADLCKGSLEGNGSLLIRSANTLESAGEDEISYAAGGRNVAAALSSRAGALIVRRDFEGQTGHALIRVDDPRQAFVIILRALYPEEPRVSGIHPTAIVHESARLQPGCSVGPQVVIEAGAELADGCLIGPGTYVGRDVRVGANCTLHPRVTLYAGVRLGQRVIVHSGAVIGADGFGFTLSGGRYQKFPQVGTVVIEDDVEIGANCCIDRAALGVTRVGAGTKLDNLIHIAHNCDIGQNVVIAAQAGFSGSVTVGDYAAIGGQAGVGEKAQIASQAVVGGKSGILTSARVPAGEPVWGIPARPLRQHLKGLANVARLPELREQIAQLRRDLKELESKLAGAGKKT
jgi:UDP-3-O-[3-hydroxymyristoyl] glucosamine N-acyltransferase